MSCQVYWNFQIGVLHDWCRSMAQVVYSFYPYLKHNIIIRHCMYSAPPPLQVQRAEVLYFKVNCPDKFSLDKFPILVYENEVHMDKFYAFPQYEYPGLTKVRISWALPMVKSHYQLLSVSGNWDIRIHGCTMYFMCLQYKVLVFPCRCTTEQLVT